MTEWRETSAGVFRGSRPHFPDEPGLAWLKSQADVSPLKRARWCAHGSDDDGLQEMLVVVRKDSPLPTHRHRAKPESLVVIEGRARLEIFSGDGRIVEAIALGEAHSGRSFHARIPADTFHSLRVETEYFIFHELTLGPWRREDTEMAPWKKGNDV